MGGGKGLAEPPEKRSGHKAQKRRGSLSGRVHDGPASPAPSPPKTKHSTEPAKKNGVANGAKRNGKKAAASQSLPQAVLERATDAMVASTVPQHRPLRAPRSPLRQVSKLAFWESLAQWFCITVCVYTLPMTMLFTTGVLWLAWLLALWVAVDVTGAAPAVLGFCGICEDAFMLFLATSLDACIYAAGQVFGLGRGAELLDTVHEAVSEGGGYRPYFLIAASVYVCAVAAYFVHIRLDRRWQGPAIGRSDRLRKSWWFRKGVRGYFPAHIYCDVDVPKHHRHLCFTRLDGSAASPDVDDAIEAAIRTYPTHDVERDGTEHPRRYLFACHPHGLFSLSVWCTFNAWTRAMDRIFDSRGFLTTVHTLAVNFRFMFWREMLLDFRFSDVARGTLRRALGGKKAEHVDAKGTKSAQRHEKASPATLKHTSGTVHESSDSPTVPQPADTRPLSKRERGTAHRPRMSVLVPGGAEESVHCTEAVLTLRKRKGFVKMVLTTGAFLVPVWTFGETDLYRPMTRHPLVTKALIKLQKIIGVGTPLVLGRNVLNIFVPQRKPLHTVLGKPIDVRQYWRRVPDAAAAAGAELPESAAGLEPGDAYFTDADVDRLHADYIDALHRLYRKYQPKLDPHGPADFTLAA